MLIALSIALLISSCYRAVRFPLTHDESVSFAIFNGHANYASTANNHILNTCLMQLFSKLLGVSEFALRAPTLLAHALYLVSGLLLLARIQSVPLRLAGFVLLNFNPFVLDFFFLARGYGMALGFLLLSIYFLTLAYEEKLRQSGSDRPPNAELGLAERPNDPGKLVRYLFCSLLMGAFAVAANFAFLNFFLPLLFICAWLLVTDESLRRMDWKQLSIALVVLALTGDFLAWVLGRTFTLQGRNEFYFGGKRNFVEDTLVSLVRSLRYNVSYPAGTDAVISAMLIALVLSLVLIGTYVWMMKTQTPVFVVYLVLLLGAVVLPIVQYLTIGTLYPIDRAALYYQPLFALTLLFAVNYWSNNSRVRWPHLALPAILALGLVFHFARSYDPNTTYSWRFNVHDGQVLDLIGHDRERAKPNRVVRLGSSWELAPTMNFYRVKRQYAWLAPVKRRPINRTDYDYIYAFERDLAKTPIPNAVRLACFQDTATVLLRVSPIRNH